MTRRIDFVDFPVGGTPVSGFAVLDGREVVQLAIKMHKAIRELNAPFGEWEWVYLGTKTVYEPFLLYVRLMIEAGELDR